MPKPHSRHSPLAEAEGPTAATDTGVLMRLAGGSWPFTGPPSAVMLRERVEQAGQAPLREVWSKQSKAERGRGGGAK